MIWSGKLRTRFAKANGHTLLNLSLADEAMCLSSAMESSIFNYRQPFMLAGKSP